MTASLQEWVQGAPVPAVTPPAGTPAVQVRRLPVAHRRPWLPLVVTALALAFWAFLAWAGSPYYRLVPAERLHHPWHPVLKPNGTAGLAYGYTGVLLLLVLIAYSARKRWHFLSRLGRLRRWLNVHIFCGILGPAFVTMHAGFRFHGLIAIGYWSMIGVMLSGFVGYYLYSQVPRALSGTKLAADALDEEILALDTELAERYGMTAAQLMALRQAADVARASRARPLGGLFFLLRQDVATALGLRRSPVHGHGAAARQMRALVQRRQRVERRRAFLRHTESLFGYWHAIHKPFAILLFLMLAMHIGVAVWLGYAWAW